MWVRCKKAGEIDVDGVEAEEEKSIKVRRPVLQMVAAGAPGAWEPHSLPARREGVARKSEQDELIERRRSHDL
eukprot:3210921-Heterocapsa_arctica.AAC.1